MGWGKREAGGGGAMKNGGEKIKSGTGKLRLLKTACLADLGKGKR